MKKIILKIPSQKHKKEIFDTIFQTFYTETARGGHVYGLRITPQIAVMILCLFMTVLFSEFGLSQTKNRIRNAVIVVIPDKTIKIMCHDTMADKDAKGA